MMIKIANQALRRGARRFAAVKIDGTAIAQTVRNEVADESASLRAKYGDAGIPGLAVVLVGARPDSATYVKMKEKASAECGFYSVKEVLPDDVGEDELHALVQKLNADATIDGILVQLPLPDHVDQKRILEAISVEKDVDGFHPYNMGGLARLGEELRQKRDGSKFSYRVAANNACTPLGCVEILDRSGVDLNGADVVVLGRSNIVGLPVSMMLLHRNATVTMCHSRTKDLKDKVAAADVVIAAIGIPEFVKGDWIKPGATVIDVGVNFKDAPERKSGKKMCGDVDYAAAAEHCGAITPGACRAAGALANRQSTSSCCCCCCRCERPQRTRTLALALALALRSRAHTHRRTDTNYPMYMRHPLHRPPRAVPGGVGPMTIAMLMRNTVENAKRRLGEE